MVQINFYLYIFEGQLFDVTPLKADITGATIATDGSTAVCTITTSSAHGINVGDIVLFDGVTLPGGTGYSASDFEDKNFQVITVQVLQLLQLHNQQLQDSIRW